MAFWENPEAATDEAKILPLGIAARRRRRERVLSTLRYGKRGEVRVVEVTVAGRSLIEIRKWFVGVDGQLRPSREHLSLPATIFGEFLSLLLATAKARQ